MPAHDRTEVKAQRSGFDIAVKLRVVANGMRTNKERVPQQIAGWLKHTYPCDEDYHVSHETIYRSLFIQARGALKKELLGVASEKGK